MCSIPIDSLTISSGTPAAFNSSLFNCLCVVEAGWQASDFASPILTNLTINFNLSINFHSNEEYNIANLQETDKWI